MNFASSQKAALEIFPVHIVLNIIINCIVRHRSIDISIILSHTSYSFHCLQFSQPEPVQISTASFSAPKQYLITLCFSIKIPGRLLKTAGDFANHKNSFTSLRNSSSVFISFLASAPLPLRPGGTDSFFLPWSASPCCSRPSSAWQSGCRLFSASFSSLS